MFFVLAVWIKRRRRRRGKNTVRLATRYDGSVTPFIHSEEEPSRGGVIISVVARILNKNRMGAQRVDNGSMISDSGMDQCPPPYSAGLGHFRIPITFDFEQRTRSTMLDDKGPW